MIIRIDAEIFTAGLSSLTRLTLTQNHIDHIDPNAFQDLGALEFLNLGRNDLASLPSGAFNGLGALKTLYLNDNPLTSLPVGVFAPLVSLELVAMHRAALTSLPAGTFINSPSLRELFLSGTSDLADLPADMLHTDTALTKLELEGTAVSSLPQNVIDALENVQRLKLPAGLAAWPTSLVLSDTITRLQIYGNDEFDALPAGVLDQSLPSNLNFLHFEDLELSAATLNAIGTHRVATGDWQYMYFVNTGLNGAKLTNLINAWCDDDPITDTTLVCEDYKGPRFVYLFNEDLSDWLDPDAGETVLNEQRAAVQSWSCGTPCLYFELRNNEMSVAQITDLLENIPAGLRRLIIRDNELNGLRVDFSRFTGLTWLYLTEAGIDSDTAEHIINNLPASIEALHLFSNDIESIPVFPSYPGLYDLRLQRNQLGGFPVGALANLIGLTSLDAGYNMLTELPEGLFDANPGFRAVYLDNNDLTELPVGLFDNNPSLYWVYLNDNELTDLQDELFDNNPCLGTVRLHNNDLTDLPGGIFAENQCIIDLSIYGNDKLDYDIDDFPNLLKLRQLRPEPPPPATPTPTLTPTPTPTATSTSMPTPPPPTPRPRPRPTRTPTSTPTPTPTPTSTPTLTPTPTSTPTHAHAHADAHTHVHADADADARG